MGFFKSIDYNKASDENLMEKVCKKNHHAFEELFERYSQRLLRYFYSMLNYDEEKSQDFLQDLFIKVLENARYFDTNRKFSTWLYSIATNMCKNEYRKLAGKHFVSEEYIPEFDEIYSSGITFNLDKKLLQSELEKSIEQLGYKHKSVFIMRFQQELPIKEISRIMSISEGTVKSRIFYSLKKLGELIPEFNPTK